MSMFRLLLVLVSLAVASESYAAYAVRGTNAPWRSVGHHYTIVQYRYFHICRPPVIEKEQIIHSEGKFYRVRKKGSTILSIEEITP